MGAFNRAKDLLAQAARQVLGPWSGSYFSLNNLTGPAGLEVIMWTLIIDFHF
jgi:hypothetical protein